MKPLVYTLWPEAGQLAGLSRTTTFLVAEELGAVRFRGRWVVPVAALAQRLGVPLDAMPEPEAKPKRSRKAKPEPDAGSTARRGRGRPRA